MRRFLAAAGLVGLLTACGSTSPAPNADLGPVPAGSPLDAVAEANDVAQQVEQRYADLEEQLRNPFDQP